MRYYLLSYFDCRLAAAGKSAGRSAFSFQRGVLLSALCFLQSAAHAQPLDHLFRGGDHGYACFRIPALVRTEAGRLIAFAEGRKNGCGDAGDIDLVMKYSDDNGRSWSALRVIWDDDSNTCGNPAPVVDHLTGRVLLLSTWNLGTDHEQQIIDGRSKDTRRIYVLSSPDGGMSWSAPREITADVKLPNWTWYATGPVNGIQLRSKKYGGRLVIPCDHIEAGTKKYYSHVIFSDDGGEQWKLGGSTPGDQVNECTVAELADGRLLLNMRNYNQLRARQTSTSMDGGLSWSALTMDTTLIEPICQGSMIRIGRKGNRLAFSNPAHKSQRVNMTVRMSDDGGKTWKRSFVLHQGPSAYSNLVDLGKGKLGCLFEAGEKSPYEGIVFREVRW